LQWLFKKTLKFCYELAEDSLLFLAYSKKDKKKNHLSDYQMYFVSCVPNELSLFYCFMQLQVGLSGHMGITHDWV